MITDKEKSIAQFILQKILNDECLSRPVYRKDVVSEQFACEQSNSLPLIYIWNENRHSGSFSISVNGSIVGGLLERVVSRTDPSFSYIRDEVISVIARVSQNSIIATCEKMGALPSDLFRMASFEYSGGYVSRKKLDEALDFLVEIEPNPESCDNYKMAMAPYQSQIEVTGAVIRKYAEQMQPMDLEGMRDAYYDIVNSDKYRDVCIERGDNIPISVISTALTHGWSGVGSWLA